MPINTDLGAEEFEAIANQYSQYIEPSEADLISIIDGDPNSSVMYGVGDLNLSSISSAVQKLSAANKISAIRREFAQAVARIYFINRATNEWHTGDKLRRNYMKFLEDLTSPKLMVEINKMFGDTPMAPFALFCELFCGKSPIVPRMVSKTCLGLNFHIMHIQALREATSRMLRSIAKKSKMNGVGEYMDPEQVADRIDSFPVLPRATVSMNNRYPLPPK